MVKQCLIYDSTHIYDFNVYSSLLIEPVSSCASSRLKSKINTKV